MALTTVAVNNKLIVFRKEVTREYIRQNLFSPYIGTEMTAIIRVINDLKNGGEQINIPLIARLKNQAISTGTLVGNEEAIDNYGDRALDRLGAQRGQDPEVRKSRSLDRPVRPGPAAARGLGQGTPARRDHRRFLCGPGRIDGADRSRQHQRPARQRRPVRCGDRRPSATPG